MSDKWIDPRPSWDEYFMNLVKVISTRSLDPHTKHGCVITDPKHRVLSIGYNGPVQGIDDSLVPMDRQLKLRWFSHAEQNALMFCKGETEGGIAYITGHPCSMCTRMLSQKGVQKVIYGDVVSRSVDLEDQQVSEVMSKSAGMELIHFSERKQ